MVLSDAGEDGANLRWWRLHRGKHLRPATKSPNTYGCKTELLLGEPVNQSRKPCVDSWGWWRVERARRATEEITKRAQRMASESALDAGAF